MEITQEKIGDLQALIKIHLEKEDYQPKVEKSIRDYSKKISLKGFRPGKVPASVIKRMYGNQILLEELNDILGEKLTNYIKESGISIIGNPIPVRDEKLQVNINETRDYEFVYELGLSPEFSIPLLDKQHKVEKFKVSVEENDIDEEINKLRKRYGTPVDPENIEENDIVYVQLNECDKEGTLVEDGIHNVTAIPVNMLDDNNLKQKFLELKKGEEMVADIFKLINKEESEIANFILNTDKDLKNSSKYYKIKVDNINRIMPAGINQDLFDKVYGEGNVKDENEFRSKLGKELEKYYEGLSERKLTQDIGEKLLDKTDIPLPDKFLMKWAKELNEEKKEPLPEEEIEDYYPTFSKNLKWNLIVNKIARDNDIQVKTEEVTEYLKVKLRYQLMQYGYTNVPESQLEEYVHRMLKDRQELNDAVESVLEGKIFEYLRTTVNLKEKEIPVEKFNKLISKE